MKSLGYLYGKFFQKVLQGRCISNSFIHKTAKINSGGTIVNSTVGRYSYTGYRCEIINTTIGNFCSIASNVCIGAAEHPTDWVSTSPVFQNTKNSGPHKRFSKLLVPQGKKTIIGNDVWIGHGAMVKAGCIIGDGAVIGAGAVVTKDVPPFSIVGGVPAHVLKQRFNDEQISHLLNIQWWHFSDEKLKKVSQYMNNLESFFYEIDRLR